MIGGSGNKRDLYNYAIAYVRDFVSDYQIMGETMETISRSNIQNVINAVSEKLNELHSLAGNAR